MRGVANGYKWIYILYRQISQVRDDEDPFASETVPSIMNYVTSQQQFNRLTSSCFAQLKPQIL